MKHLILTGILFVLACAPLSAEVIQTINFNPARLGQYERLKVSEKATFQGGLTAQSMQVNSGGTVSINESNSGALAYDVPLLDGRKGKTDSDVLSTFPAQPTLDFEGTCFSSLENCVTSSTPGSLNVKFNGGAARFQGPAGYSDPASRINQVTTNANRLRLESVYATVKGKLNITGVGTYSYRNLSASTPLRLAGNWVPLPSTNGVGAKTLAWETRKTVKHPDKGGESVKILVLKGNGGTTPTPPTCTAQACPSQPCPSGQTGQINYTWSQSQCKCVESSRTCNAGCTKQCEWYETLDPDTCTCSSSFTLTTPGGYMGLFINNRRVETSLNHTVYIGDTVMMERPCDANTKWYVNGQYIGKGAVVSFAVSDYVYSASGNRFNITFEKSVSSC